MKDFTPAIVRYLAQAVLPQQQNSIPLHGSLPNCHPTPCSCCFPSEPNSHYFTWDSAQHSDLAPKLSDSSLNLISRRPKNHYFAWVPAKTSNFIPTDVRPLARAVLPQHEKKKNDCVRLCPTLTFSRNCPTPCSSCFFTAQKKHLLYMGPCSTL